MLRKKLHREWFEETTAIFHWKIARPLGVGELNCSVRQRTGAAGESRVSLHTLPNRHRPKPRIDCDAILGKLSERVGALEALRSLESLGVIGKLEKIGSLRSLGVIGKLGSLGNLGAIGYNKYKYRYLFC